MQLERQTIKFSKDPSGKAKGEPDQQCPLLTLPFVPCRKWKEKWALSERSEFRPFPIFCAAQTGTRRAAAGGRLSLLTFFGEAKKVSGSRATPGN